MIINYHKGGGFSIGEFVELGVGAKVQGFLFSVPIPPAFNVILRFSHLLKPPP